GWGAPGVSPRARTEGGSVLEGLFAQDRLALFGWGELGEHLVVLLAKRGYLRVQLRELVLHLRPGRHGHRSSRPAEPGQRRQADRADRRDRDCLAEPSAPASAACRHATGHAAPFPLRPFSPS